ncbi:hypothetical protein V494_00147 [Pseudogymnoascus sp. VKM F-4513 (FW-928)]|nr:hypothetical protein V494_00147 [Pseudogymnoascus sp. VKM F-4513 (FW-928)]
MQHRRQRSSSLQSTQATVGQFDNYHTRSPSETSEIFEQSQISDICVGNTVYNPLTQSEPFVADFTDVDDAGETAENSQQTACLQPNKLQLLHIDEWDDENTYDEVPPNCIHYSIEWKVTLNGKLISKDTEQNLVLAPIFYWAQFLKPKLEKLLRKKISSNKRVTPDDTNVVVSVTDRSERDLTKRFDETEIGWPVIEQQLVTWGEFFRAGKKLRVDLSFNYLETGQQPATSSRKVDKRSLTSATQQMLGERAMQIDAEEETSGQPSIWREVYNLMRCPGPPCHLGPHCWRDPIGKKHYKLKTHQLKSLIRHVEHGGQLRSHDDVPESIRQQIYAEDQQRLERYQKPTITPSSNLPPINITNVLPGPSHQSVTSVSPMADQPPPITPLGVTGFRDAAVKEYSNWQQSKVVDLAWKAEFQKACDVAMAHGLDLEQIYKDQDASFFTTNGVMLGIARRFVSDIKYWVKQHKLVRTTDTLN